MVFYKMQGWGNDFIMIPEYDSNVDYSKLAEQDYMYTILLPDHLNHA